MVPGGFLYLGVFKVIRLNCVLVGVLSTRLVFLYVRGRLAVGRVWCLFCGVGCDW